ncbi:DUF3307 domain-containing protein [Pseudonocardia sp. DSM 110487]|uniref:DUF3307 domain-containing protein n=1 Tax=Pseudonocardia sp. DSM 110487 TaxID=2865833 RepID=UPI00210618E7|nr:DUF3307 domain-containing protein [Pseudonocardia sp. DSM 110487]
MSNLDMAGAVSFAVVLPALLVAHQVADHWVQTDHQAGHKGLPGWAGRWACGKHVATYTVVTTLAVLGVWAMFALPLGWGGVLVGQLVSAVTHYWADRRTTLAALAEASGSGAFYRLGAPRAGRDDNPSLGTGAYALDQSWHWLWLGVAAAATALIGGGAS